MTSLNRDDTQPGMETLQASECTQPVCQKCGGEIQGWICQHCNQAFREDGAGNLIFHDDAASPPMEAVAWREKVARIVSIALHGHDESADQREQTIRTATDAILAVIPAPGNKEEKQ